MCIRDSIIRVAPSRDSGRAGPLKLRPLQRVSTHHVTHPGRARAAKAQLPAPVEHKSEYPVRRRSDEAIHEHTKYRRRRRHGRAGHQILLSGESDLAEEDSTLPQIMEDSRKLEQPVDEHSDYNSDGSEVYMDEDNRSAGDAASASEDIRRVNDSEAASDDGESLGNEDSYASESLAEEASGSNTSDEEMISDESDYSRGRNRHRKEDGRGPPFHHHRRFRQDHVRRHHRHKTPSDFSDSESARSSRRRRRHHDQKHRHRRHRSTRRSVSGGESDGYTADSSDSIRTPQESQDSDAADYDSDTASAKELRRQARRLDIVESAQVVLRFTKWASVKLTGYGDNYDEFMYRRIQAGRYDHLIRRRERQLRKGKGKQWPLWLEALYAYGMSLVTYFQMEAQQRQARMDMFQTLYGNGGGGGQASNEATVPEDYTVSAVKSGIPAVGGASMARPVHVLPGKLSLIHI